MPKRETAKDIYNLKEQLLQRNSFETFKSNICHELKTKGDLEFIIDILKNNEIRSCWERKWYAECFYLLAMVDYLCREHELPICADYDDIRKFSLANPLYPADVNLIDELIPLSDCKQRSIHHAIPEFMKFNIVECDIRNVC